MTPVQRTFERGNYTGHWIEDPETALTQAIAARHELPLGGSGSLQILFKGEEEIVLVDKAEHSAQKVFDNYCEPDWQEMAEAILSAYQRGGTPFSEGLKAVGDNERHIQHDVYVVRKILHSLLVAQGIDPQDFSEFDKT